MKSRSVVRLTKKREDLMASFFEGLHTWGEHWRSILPFAGSLLVVAATIWVGLRITWQINTAMKSAEFFLKFTERYHALLSAAHE